MRREHDTGGVAARLGLADDDDGIGGVLEGEPVRRAELRRIGERGIAGEQLELDTERRERLDEPLPIGLGVHRDTVPVAVARWANRTTPGRPAGEYR